MADQEKLFEQVCDHARETAKLQTIMAVLEWDERTKLPVGGGPYRVEQIALLSGLIHQRRTESAYGERLGELRESLHESAPYSDASATIRELHREFEKQSKLPQSLVEELTRASIVGQQAWVESRKNDDFPSFQPKLEKIIELLRQKADAIGFADSPYDPLLDDYEPGAKTSEVAAALSALREELSPLVAQIVGSSVKAPVEIIQRSFDLTVQERMGKLAAERIGFDFERGRLDVTAHPFCTTLGPADCRITTRYEENFFNAAFFGTLHEAGHGIYEQGLRDDQFGLPPGSYASLGVHESQSRLWENLVGRSRSFWTHFYPELRQAFPSSLSDVSDEQFHFAVNDVRPSLIRVEADEATYNLHIIIRFELEQELLVGNLKAADLPTAWNERYRDYLGVESPTDADGVLQDVHWSATLIGYFPTYSLGNLFSAQLFEAAENDLGDLHAAFARGEFTPLREWLARKVFQAGRTRNSSQLIEHVTGRPPGHEALMSYLRIKYGELYDLN